MMEVSIWSDVRCPFCYIGKHIFEAALASFEQKEKIKIKWRSFELDPNLKTDPDTDIFSYFNQTKGISKAQAEQMMVQMEQRAKEAGLRFDFETSVVANSFHAHRLIQYAQTKDLGSTIEDALFKAHFTDGKNIDDKEELLHIGLEIGLEKKELDEILSSNAFTEQVKADQDQARSLGIGGVPFFVFNNKYAVSGAQPAEVFSKTLKTSWEEFEKENSPLIVNEGATCSTDGKCD